MQIRVRRQLAHRGVVNDAQVPQFLALNGGYAKKMHRYWGSAFSPQFQFLWLTLGCLLAQTSPPQLRLFE